MEYKNAVENVFMYFKKNNVRIISTKQVLKVIGEDNKKTFRKYIKQMVADKLLSIGPSYFIRNDRYYRQLNGYKVFIKSSASHVITLSEWLEHVDNNNDFTYLGHVELYSPIGEYKRVESKGLVAWNGNPDENDVLFDYDDNKIVVRNPDSCTLKKMHRISLTFNGSVQGDDEEYYDKDGLHFYK